MVRADREPRMRDALPANAHLLAPDEPHPLEVLREGADSDFLLICEHAGRRIPRALGTLGLGEADLGRHIAWDIGARDVAVALSDRLGAPLHMQRYSRLVCDCNRRPDVPGFAPERSEATTIPGNLGLGPEERARRAEAIFHPFHGAVAAALDGRAAAGRRTFLVTVHSFTPVYLGVPRPWEIGVLYQRDRDFAPVVGDWLSANTGHRVGVNQPYSVGHDTDYAIPVHGEGRGLPCVEFEIRNDLIDGPPAALRWAGLLARALEAAVARYRPSAG
jgi:predicted N-formylglutamate amidohydrolase